MDRGFKGIWIPKEVWLSEELSLQEKVLLVEIESLDNDKGCFASNEHFAKFLGLSKDRVSRIVSSLKEKGYVVVSLNYNSDKRKTERIIRVVKEMFYGVDRPSCFQQGGSSRKRQGGIGGNAKSPLGENANYNNTVINNTLNNTKEEQLQRQENLNNLDNAAKEKEKPVVVVDAEFSNLTNFYSENIGPLTPMISEELNHMTDDLNAELALLALKESVIANARNKIRYAQSIIKSWKSQNFKTITDVESAEKRRKSGGHDDAAGGGDTQSDYDYGF